ncbi:MAG TPA: alkyl sulfatase dimerization domain-containing protein [Actinomycetota bacterium]|nr:alkyl sulfatase dimerization domain-containing protein [Actinomycetota bacterium]
MIDLADRLWRGEASTEEHHPLFGPIEGAEVAPATLFVRAFGNVTAFAAGDGLVLVDAGSAMTAAEVHRAVREWSHAPVTTAAFTHGHIDHVLGLRPFEAQRPIRVVAHRDVPRRFERYLRTAGYNAAINARQFGVPGLEWPTEYRFPDETYDRELVLEAGGERFELRHARGETEDATWVWVPARRVLCTGDLFIWALPNAGNPQKVQRYPDEWAAALREMAALQAEVLLPGHGWPVLGAGRVREALESTADLLESLVEETLEAMNAGATLDEVLMTVRPSEELLARPWLRPVYDDPEFVVRSVWRLYGGWWDGDPAALKPAPRRAVAEEVARLAGGAGRVAERAGEVAAAGDLRLAAHLAEWAALAAPDDEAARSARSEVYARRAAEEPSTMARGIFNSALEP